MCFRAAGVADTPLVTAMRSLDYTGIARVLTMIADPNTDVNAADRHGKSPLIWAVLKGDLRAVEALLARRDVNINHADNSGRTALLYAAIGENERIIQVSAELGTGGVFSPSKCSNYIDYLCVCIYATAPTGEV